MRKLKKAGFFRELPHGDVAGPSLRESVRANGDRDEDKILEYLQSGIVLVGTPGPTWDVLTASNLPLPPPHILTDGVWSWPADLAHYVRTYHVDLDQEFVNYMRWHEWRVPDDIDVESLAL